MERALYQGLIVSGGLAALAFLPITLGMMDDLTFKGGVSELLRGGGDAAQRDRAGSARWSGSPSRRACS